MRAPRKGGSGRCPAGLVVAQQLRVGWMRPGSAGFGLRAAGSLRPSAPLPRRRRFTAAYRRPRQDRGAAHRLARFVTRGPNPSHVNRAGWSRSEVRPELRLTSPAAPMALMMAATRSAFTASSLELGSPRSSNTFPLLSVNRLLAPMARSPSVLHLLDIQGDSTGTSEPRPGPLRVSMDADDPWPDKKAP